MICALIGLVRICWSAPKIFVGLLKGVLAKSCCLKDTCCDNEGTKDEELVFIMFWAHLNGVYSCVRRKNCLFVAFHLHWLCSVCLDTHTHTRKHAFSLSSLSALIVRTNFSVVFFFFAAWTHKFDKQLLGLHPSFYSSVVFLSFPFYFFTSISAGFSFKTYRFGTFIGTTFIVLVWCFSFFDVYALKITTEVIQSDKCCTF